MATSRVYLKPKIPKSIDEALIALSDLQWVFAKASEGFLEDKAVLKKIRVAASNVLDAHRALEAANKKSREVFIRNLAAQSLEEGIEDLKSDGIPDNIDRVIMLLNTIGVETKPEFFRVTRVNKAAKARITANVLISRACRLGNEGGKKGPGEKEVAETVAKMRKQNSTQHEKATFFSAMDTILNREVLKGILLREPFGVLPENVEAVLDFMSSRRKSRITLTSTISKSSDTKQRNHPKH